MVRASIALLVGSMFVTSPSIAAKPKRCRVERPRPLSHVPGAGVRPVADVTLPSLLGYPFLVHAPQAHAALASTIRDAADLAWQREIDEGPWPPPLPDDDGPDAMLDIYVDDTLQIDEAYVASETYPLNLEFDAATCFMGLAEEFSDPDILVSTVFHELNHASQFAIDAFEDDAFFEQTAIFAEATFAGELVAYGLGIDDYQQNPERALDYIGKDFYEYGSALWLLFLAQELGGDAPVLQLWLDSRQLSDGVNEPDFLDVLPDQIGELGPFFARYAAARWFTGSRDDGMHFADGALWGEGSLVPVQTETLVDQTTLSAAIGPFGAAYFELSVDDEMPIRVEVSGPSAFAAIVALDRSTEVIVADGTAALELQLLPRTDALLVALTTAPPDYDPDDDDWTKVEVRATFTRVVPGADARSADATITDGGSAPVEERDGACSCTARRRTSSSLLGVALVLVMFLAKPRMKRATQFGSRRNDSIAS